MGSRRPKDLVAPPQKARTDRILPIVTVSLTVISVCIALATLIQTRHRDNQQLPLSAGEHVVRVAKDLGNLDSTEVSPIVVGLNSVNDTVAARILVRTGNANQRRRKPSPVMVPTEPDSARRLVNAYNERLRRQPAQPILVLNKGEYSLDSTRIVVLSPTSDTSRVALPSGQRIPRSQTGGWGIGSGGEVCQGRCGAGQICCAIVTVPRTSQPSPPTGTPR